MRRNKIKTGWDAVPIKKKRFQKSKISWSTKYEFKHLKEDNYVSKIIKLIINISLLFAFNKKNLSKTKKNATINYTYNILSSSKFKFIPSSVAFYLFLSIIPIIIIMLSIISLINQEWSKFLIDDILPNIIPGINLLFTTSVDFKSSNFLLVLFFIISSLWFASKGINKFRDSFAELYGYVDTQNFIAKRLKSTFIVILISLYFTIVSLAFIPLMIGIRTIVKNELFYNFIFYSISFVFLVIFGYIGIGLLFKHISSIQLKWSYLNLGLLTSLIPIVIFFLIFSTLSKFLNYEKFGAIGSFLYLIIFILYISYFLHAGIIINSSYYKANILQNVVIKKSLISKKFIIMCKNIWYKFKWRH